VPPPYPSPASGGGDAVAPTFNFTETQSTRYSLNARSATAK
jgi:hypothetical protein